MATNQSLLLMACHSENAWRGNLMHKIRIFTQASIREFEYPTAPLRGYFALSHTRYIPGVPLCYRVESLITHSLRIHRTECNFSQPLSVCVDYFLTTFLNVSQKRW